MMSNQNTILCPECGNDVDMHITGVKVFMRDEDKPVGNYASVSTDHMESSSGTPLPPGSPSVRREGLTMEFFCNCCGACPVLKVAQHKGKTFFTWWTKA